MPPHAAPGSARLAGAADPLARRDRAIPDPRQRRATTGPIGGTRLDGHGRPGPVERPRPGVPAAAGSAARRAVPASSVVALDRASPCPLRPRPPGPRTSGHAASAPAHPAGRLGLAVGPHRAPDRHRDRRADAPRQPGGRAGSPPLASASSQRTSGATPDAAPPRLAGSRRRQAACIRRAAGGDPVELEPTLQAQVEAVLRPGPTIAAGARSSRLAGHAPPGSRPHAGAGRTATLCRVRPRRVARRAVLDDAATLWAAAGSQPAARPGRRNGRPWTRLSTRPRSWPIRITSSIRRSRNAQLSRLSSDLSSSQNNSVDR